MLREKVMNTHGKGIINTFIVSQVSPQAGRRIQVPKEAAQVKSRQLVIKGEWEKARKSSVEPGRSVKDDH